MAPTPHVMPFHYLDRAHAGVSMLLRSNQERLGRAMNVCCHVAHCNADAIIELRCVVEDIGTLTAMLENIHRAKAAMDLACQPSDHTDQHVAKSASAVVGS
jgi:hypothetical protein